MGWLWAPTAPEPLRLNGCAVRFRIPCGQLGAVEREHVVDDVGSPLRRCSTDADVELCFK